MSQNCSSTASPILDPPGRRRNAWDSATDDDAKGGGGSLDVDEKATGVKR